MATKKVTPAAAKTTAKKAAAKKATAKKATTKKATTKAKTTRTKKTKPVVTEADIRQRAQEIYNARVASGEPGDENTDWLKAEEQLKAGK